MRHPYSARATTCALLLTTAAILGCANTGVLTPTKLGFDAQPTNATANSLIGVVTVDLLTSEGATFLRSGDTVTMTLSPNSTGASLNGSTTRVIVDGVTSFDDLSVDKPGTYTLQASAHNLTAATSATFTISP